MLIFAIWSLGWFILIWYCCILRRGIAWIATQVVITSGITKHSLVPFGAPQRLNAQWWSFFSLFTVTKIFCELGLPYILYISTIDTNLTTVLEVSILQSQRSVSASDNSLKMHTVEWSKMHEVLVSASRSRARRNRNARAIGPQRLLIDNVVNRDRSLFRYQRFVMKPVLATLSRILFNTID